MTLKLPVLVKHLPVTKLQEFPIGKYWSLADNNIPHLWEPERQNASLSLHSPTVWLLCASRQPSNLSALHRQQLLNSTPLFLFLQDRHFNMVEYHVPVSAGGVANIFDLLEGSKEAFKIRHFSVSQTTLEEVRN